MKLKNPKHTAKTLAALGIDSASTTYHYDGEELLVDGVSDVEIEAAEASLDVASLDKELHNLEVREQRRARYHDVGDVIDKILKQFNYMRLNGIDMIQEIDDELGFRLAVKKELPKEK